MPIYEYRCTSCGRTASIFFRSIASIDPDPACPQCGQASLSRRMSRVWSPRSRESDDGLFGEPDFESQGVPMYGGDPSLSEDDYGGGFDADGIGEDDGDIIEFAREARTMAQMMGEPLEPEFDAALRHIEQGADPDEVFGEMDAAAPEPMVESAPDE